MKLAALHTADGTQAAVSTDSGWVPLPFADVAELLGDDGWKTIVASALDTPPRPHPGR